MADKKSFVAYYSWWDVLKELDDHRKALVLEAMFSTGGVCDMPELDALSKIAYIPIERAISENLEKWERTREKRREAGAKGGKAKAENAKHQDIIAQDTALANASKCYQELANVAVNDNVNDNVNVIVNDNNKTYCASNDAPHGGMDTKSDAKKESKAKKRKEANEHFDKMWALYPQKRGKSAVSETTRIKLLQVSIEDMQLAINRYSAEVQSSTFERSRLNGSTWFNGRYMDYLGTNYQPPKPTNTVTGSNKGHRYVNPEGFRDFSSREE